MPIADINAESVRMKNAQVTLDKYTDGTVALVATDTDEDGMPNVETLSVNLTAYGLTPPDGFLYIKDYSEGVGVTAELARLGFVKPEARFPVGPFRVQVWLVRMLSPLVDESVFERTDKESAR